MTTIILGSLVILLGLLMAVLNTGRTFRIWILVIPILPWYLGVSILSDRYVINLPRLLFVLLSMVFILRILTNRVKIGAPPLRGFFLACIIAYTLSAVFSLLPVDSLVRLVSELWLGAFVIFYLAFFSIHSKIDANRALSILLLGAAIVSIIAVVTTLFKIDYRQMFSFWAPYSRYMTSSVFSVESLTTGRSFRGQINLLRNAASLSHELELGSYLVFLLPLAWGRIFYTKNKWRYCILVILMFCGIIFSFERAPLLFAAIAIALMTWITRRGVKLTLAIIAGLAIIVVLFYVHPDVDWGRGSTNPYSVSSFMAYIQPYSSYPNLFLYRPLLGLGPEVSNIIYFNMNSQPTITNIRGTPIKGWDSPILLRLQEIGVLGVLCWLGFLGRCGYLIWRQGIQDLRNSAQVGVDQIAAVVALIIALLACTFQAGVFAWPQSTTVVMIYLGITLRTSLIRSREDRSC